MAADSPVQRVRLATAHAHILLSDTGTRDDGHQMLEKTSALAAANGLMHQRRSIQTIHRDFERAG
ncbi:hypothetical protein [Actinomadura hibisca]|uniref:hypothetical protein n=1 Tax=Actinomadura hibisca TaxID=68565 RepID=UPI0012F9F7D1|nr:hypothetical protein [Actinomadura hibisca]